MNGSVKEVRRGRPRSEVSRRAVLDAAYKILIEDGLDTFSIEAVSIQSGVARTTIYRWWPTKGALAIEGFLEAFGPQLSFDRRENAAASFRELAHTLAAALRGPAGKLAATVVAQAQIDPEVKRLFVANFSEPLRSRSSELLHFGVANGEFREDLEISSVLDALVGGIYFRLLFGQSLSKDWVETFADTLLQGCAV